MKSKKVRRIIIILILIISILTVSNIFLEYKFGLNLADIISLKFPVQDTIKTEFPNKFFLSNPSYFEKQKRSQCGGYSSAYVLRFLGENAKGEETYNSMNYKLSNGYILPQALIKTFDKYTFNAVLYRGSLETLKTRLVKGIPVIVIIGDGVKWQHYVTVTGYDEDNIYLFDSNFDASALKGYNRIMSNSEFVNQWQNKLPLFEQTYFVIQQKAK